MGKMVLFSAIAFFILTRDTIFDIKNFKYKKQNLIFIFLSFATIPFFFSVAGQLLLEKGFNSNLPLSTFTHFLAILIPILLVIGVFGIEFIKYFVQKYKKVIIICLSISIVFYFAIFQVWRLWPYFSGVVLKGVSFLLSLHSFPVREIGYLTLMVDDFAVRIEQACSGVESIFLFSVLYILIALVEWKRFDRKRLILAFVPALIGLFIVNIMRVYLLILVGVYFSPQIMLKLFHTYLGMVLFMIYFGAFWAIFYKRLLK